MINVNKWHITGYAGFYDCDDPEDYNLNYFLHLDSTINKAEIEAMLLARYKDKRVVVLNIKPEPRGD